jgi:hypothetical protein
VKQVTQTVTSSPVTAPVVGAVAAPVHTAIGTIGSSSGSTVKNARTSVREATATVTHIAPGTVGGVARAGVSSAGGDTSGTYRGVPTDRITRRAPDGSGPISQKPGDGTQTTGPWGNLLKELSRDGSIRAPLPKWMAYIWPAIALTVPGLADFLEHWESQDLSLAAGTGVEGTGTSGSFGVAGVHAPGGKAGAPDSSSLPFSKIASAIGHFPYNAPGAALGYLLIVAIMLIALFAAVKWEMTRERREGRG